MEEKIKTETKSKYNYKVIALSIVIYYMVEIGLSLLLFIFSLHISSNYLIIIAGITAIYFYNTRKDKKYLKKKI